jgi:hypothetical protein
MTEDDQTQDDERADELRAYTVQCVLTIRDGEDLTDREFIAVCKAIGAMPEEVLLHIIEHDGEPEEIAQELRGGKG